MTHPPKPNTQTLSIKLATTVLAPTLLGMTLRASHPRVKRWVARHKTGLSLLSVFNLVMLLWQILSGARDVLLAQSGTALALAAGAVIAQVCCYLCMRTPTHKGCIEAGSCGGLTD